MKAKTSPSQRSIRKNFRYSQAARKKTSPSIIYDAPVTRLLYLCGLSLSGKDWTISRIVKQKED